MKKRLAAGFAAALMLAVTLMLSGCFNELLYGTWRLSYTADEYGKNRKDYLLPYPGYSQQRRGIYDRRLQAVAVCHLYPQ